MPNRHAIILFDGQCCFCSRSVQFIIKHDKTKFFKFTPSQSDIAQRIKAAYHIENVTGTMILIRNGKVFTHSDAVLRIAQELNMPWKLAKVFLLVPAGIRNAMYRFVSRNRHRFASGKQTCMVPTDDVQVRFEIADADWS
jgi:predicted DCC family thiol-disulfide oxidoreductase YuxK